MLEGTEQTARLKVLLDPAPRRTAEIFSDATLAELNARFEVAEWAGDDRDTFYATHLRETAILISQQPMEADRLAEAPALRAIFNVETNFLPNVDYAECFRRGIHVLAPSSVFAVPVAEMGLGMALSLARGIHVQHGRFLEGREAYGLEDNIEAELLTGTDIGMIGYGDLGRALHRLLAVFQPTLRVFDPWLPDGTIRRAGAQPAALDAVLRQSRVVFVVSAITTENANLLDAAALAKMQDGAMLVLLSRAAVADFDALAAEAQASRLRIATDVFPEEPVAPDDPIRQVPNILFSPHRAGALTSTLHAIGDLVLEDMDLIARGLPPVSCKRAERETIARLRSKPIESS